METSTPKRPIPTSKQADREWSNETPLRVQRVSVLLEKNDNVWKSNDCNERDNRRVSLSARKSMFSKQNEIEESPGLNDSIRALSEKDIKSQLIICSKLNAENKINAKNAWKLKIIELLNQFVRKNNPDVLRVAGNSLEVAGKVYGIRVDDLHAESLKLASNLARTVDKRAAQDDNENDDHAEADDEDEAGQKKKKPKKKTFLRDSKKQTIFNDPNAYKDTLPKLESAAFSAKVDNSLSAADNLFTNNMRTDNTGYRFIFLGEEKGFLWDRSTDHSIDPLPLTLEVDLPSDIKVCAAFKDFEVDVWDPNEDDIELCRKGLSSATVVYDEDGIPIPELDGSVHDVFQDIVDDDVHDDDGPEEVVLPPIFPEHGTILNFQSSDQIVVNSVHRSDYSYNSVIGTCSGKIDQIWAGPSHWKIKHIRKSRVPIYSGQDGLGEHDKDKRKTVRKKNEPNMIDFENFEDQTKTFKIFLKKKILKEVNESKITFPLFHSACGDLIEHIDELIMVPSMKPINKDKVNIDCEINNEYRFDNPNDSNYIPNRLVDDDDQPDLADDIFGDEPHSFEDEAARAAFTDDNLIRMPELVTQADMHFALRAKKMDMKKLKAAVWSILTDSDNNELSKAVKAIAFSTMYKVLPQKITENMKKELNCSLAFVALLHLCNEQNLFLKKGEGIADFEILGSR